LVTPSGRHSIAYSQAKLIDNLEKPFDWLMVEVNASQAIPARNMPCLTATC